MADGGRNLLVDASKANCYAVSDPAIVAECRVAAYDDAAETVDLEIAPDGCLARQLDTGDDLDQLIEEFV